MYGLHLTSQASRNSPAVAVSKPACRPREIHWSKGDQRRRRERGNRIQNCRALMNRSQFHWRCWSAHIANTAIGRRFALTRKGITLGLSFQRRVFLSARQILAENIDWVLTKCFADFDEFHEINSALSTLNLGNKGLTIAQAPSKHLLSDASALSS